MPHNHSPHRQECGFQLPVTCPPQVCGAATRTLHLQRGSWPQPRWPQPPLTFLFGGVGQCVLVLVLPCNPAVLHAAEEGSASSGGHVVGSDGGLHRDLNSSYTHNRGHSRLRGFFEQTHLCRSRILTLILLDASMRRWRGSSSEDDSCSFTLLMSLG